MRFRLMLLVSLFVSGSIVALGGFDARVAATSTSCDPGLQENPGCCDRAPENGNLCCTEPTETQYVYPDGTYSCYDCKPDPTAPECCPEDTTWWEYKNGTHDCLPYFVVMPMPEDTEARVNEGTVGACENGDWADELATWVATDGATPRPRCISQSLDTAATSGGASYDTRYGTYGVHLVLLPPPGASTAAVSTTELTLTGYSGIGTDCGRCPPGGLLLQTDCLAYYDGHCASLSVESAAAGLQPLP